MALYWDEIESTLSLELSVTKNAGKLLYFFNFHAVGYRLTSSWVFNAIAMKCHKTILLCSPVWAGLAVLPTSAASPGHLCQHQDHTQCWASASNSHPFEPAPQPAQRQFLILLVHLCFGHPCFTALYRRLMGKRFCQGKEGGRAGGQMFLDIAWHLRNCCSRWRAEKGGTPSLSKVELSSSISFLFPFSTKF